MSPPTSEEDATPTAGADAPELLADLDAWLEAAVDRQAPLTFTDLRKGVRALSARYVERRRREGVDRDAFASPAKRAAFATYYAALHLETAFRAASEAWPTGRLAERVIDLGAGSGAAGAGAARALGVPAVLGLERSGWALREARATYAAFGLRGRTRRAELPGALPRPRAGDLLVAGWVLNECAPEVRNALIGGLEAALRAGGSVLILEPLAGAVAPWFDGLATRLAPVGCRSFEARYGGERPAWVSKMDHAAGLDHRELRARVLAGPES
jgi:SAM-dependent methyltransferase